MKIPEEAALTPEGLRQHRIAYVAAMRAYNAGEIERRMRSWTLPFKSAGCGPLICPSANPAATASSAAGWPGVAIAATAHVPTEISPSLGALQ